MMNYNEKIQFRAEAMAKSRWDNSQGPLTHTNSWDSLGSGDRAILIEEELPLAILSLTWSANDYEEGYKQGETDFVHRQQFNSPRGVSTHLVNLGYKDTDKKIN